MSCVVIMVSDQEIRTDCRRGNSQGFDTRLDKDKILPRIPSATLRRVRIKRSPSFFSNSHLILSLTLFSTHLHTLPLVQSNVMSKQNVCHADISLNNHHQTDLQQGEEIKTVGCDRFGFDSTVDINVLRSLYLVSLTRRDDLNPTLFSLG